MIFNKDKYLQVLIRVRAWTWCVGLNETHWPLIRYHDQNEQVVLKSLAFWVSLIRSKLPTISLCRSLKGKYGSPIFNCLLEPVGCSLDADNRPRSFSRRKRGYFPPSNSFLSFYSDHLQGWPRPWVLESCDFTFGSVVCTPICCFHLCQYSRVKPTSKHL